MAAQLAPGGILGEPRVVFVAEIDGAAEPVQGLGLVAIDGEIGGEAVGHLAVGFGGGEGFFEDEAGGLGAVAELHVAHGDGGEDDAQAALVGDDCFEGVDGAVQVAQAHVLVAERDAQQRLAGLKGEALLDLFSGELELVLILIDARAMVVDHGGIGGVEAEREVELVERFLV